MAAMCASNCDSVKAEMRTCMEDELRALLLQQSKDVTRFSKFSQGLMKKIVDLEDKPDSLREEVASLRNEVSSPSWACALLALFAFGLVRA